MIRLLVSILLVTLVVAQRQTGFAVVYKDDEGSGYQGAWLGLNGTTTCSNPVKLPAPSAGCRWELSEGTRGQTSAMFHTNMTHFFFGQEICLHGTVGRTTLFQTFGPWCGGGSGTPMRIFPVATLQTKEKLEKLNVAWDHTCNLVVLYPNQLRNGTAYQTKQVSEYDGQIRPRPDYSFEPTNSLWKKIPGLGALDNGDNKPQWNLELNCGERCVMYTLEQRAGPHQDYPRALIGRYYRSGVFASNTSDSVRLQSLEYVPFYRVQQQFLGVGYCCNWNWCHPQCKAFPNRLVLVSFIPGPSGSSGTLKVLSDIGEMDKDTIRLGVEFSNLYASSYSAFIYHQQSIITYQLTITSDGIISAAQATGRSPKIDHHIISWGALPSLGLK